MKVAPPPGAAVPSRSAVFRGRLCEALAKCIVEGGVWDADDASLRGGGAEGWVGCWCPGWEWLAALPMALTHSKAAGLQHPGR